MIKIKSKPMNHDEVVKAIRERADLIATAILVQQEDEAKRSESIADYISSRASGYTLLIDIISHEI